ncbi:MAG: T9SS type A sorting domain-containing protein [Bacteroidales bacterium]|jgi:hypothetical protein|nr:T9SS type A sorting domain-containing protein [Bacteroidales bacterium]
MKKALLLYTALFMFTITTQAQTEITDVTHTEVYVCKDLEFTAVFPEKDETGKKFVRRVLFYRLLGVPGAYIDYEMSLCDSAENRYCVTISKRAITENGLEWVIVGINDSAGVTPYGGVYTSLYESVYDPNRPENIVLATVGFLTGSGINLETADTLYPKIAPNDGNEKMYLVFDSEKMFHNCLPLEESDIVNIYFKDDCTLSGYQRIAADTISSPGEDIVFELHADSDSTDSYKNGFDEGEDIIIKIIHNGFNYAVTIPNDNPLVYTTGDSIVYSSELYAASIPIVSLSGNGISIESSNTPSVANGTDFDSVAVETSHTFYLINSGCYTLTVYSLSVNNTAYFFTAGISGTTTVPAGDSIPFTLTYNPLANATAKVTITSNAGSANTFSVKGSVGPLNIDSICEGDSYLFNGEVYTEAGIYRDTVSSSLGVDSVVVLQLFSYPVYEVSAEDSVAYGGTYNFGTQTLTQSGTYYETFQSVHGCDSTVTIDFTVLPDTPKYTEITKILCGGTYEFAGQTLNTSGIYTDSLETVVSKVDSIVTLYLTINPEIHYEIDTTVIIAYDDTISLGSLIITNEGVYTETLTASTGCDSVVTLTVKQQTSISKGVCTEYNFNETNLTESGIYTDTLQNTAGNDSIVVIELEVYGLDTIFQEQTINYGNSIYFFDQQVSKSGQYEYLYERSCRIWIMTLTVLPLTERTDTTVCGAFEFGGDILETSGTYTDTLQDAEGNDSLVQTLTITINPTYSDTLRETIAYGESYNFEGNTYTQTGTYTEAFTSEAGCDSTVTLNLTVEVNTIPEITIDSTHFEIAADSENGTEITTITARDAEGADLTYSLSSETGAFSIDASGQITVADAGQLIVGESYSLIVSVSDGTDTASVTISVRVTSGTYIEQQSQTIRIYPTLVNGILHVESGYNTASLTISTASGTKVYQTNIEEYATVDCSNFAAGTYVVRVQSGGEVVMKRVVVQ